MTGFKTGEMDWDSTDIRAEAGSPKGDSLFLNMKDPGDYTIRVISKPHQYYAHWVKDSEGKDRKVNCALTNCPVCLESNKGPQARWLLLVLHRADKGNEPKLLDCSTQIFGQLKALANHSKWGDLRHYDVTITRGRKGANPLYNVNPNPKEAITTEEKEMLKTYMQEGSEKYIDIGSLCIPWTVERIDEILSGNTSEGTTEKENSKSSKPEESKLEEVVATSTSDDDDFFNL